MKVLLLLLVLAIAAPSASAQTVSTTDFCSDARDCCLKWADCQAAIAGGFNITGGDQWCLFPNCPLGFSTCTSSNLCCRADATVTPATVPAYQSLGQCLSATSGATPYTTSYQIRHCIEGLNQVKRQCLFNLGLKA